MKKLLFKALLFSSAFCQVKLDGQFFNYTAYYLSNFDLVTGKSDAPVSYTHLTLPTNREV